MNSDIRILTSFRGHRKRKKLQLKLGADGVIALIDLWVGVAVNRPSGVLVGWDEVDIALEANWSGDPSMFVDVLCDIGFVDCDDDNAYSMRNWEENQAWVVGAEARKAKAKHAARQRWEKRTTIPVDATSMPPVSKEDACGNAPSPNPNPSPSPSPKPILLDRPKTITKELWDELIANRKKKKLSNSKLALTTILNAFQKGVDAGYSIDECIGQFVTTGWTRFNHEWIKGSNNGTSKRNNSRGNGYVEAGKKDYLA